MLTNAIAIAIGGYAVAAGTGMFLDRGKVAKLLEGLRESPALCYVTGAFVYALGAIILIAHYRWDGILEAVITVLGWAALLEGLAFLIAPRFLLNLAARASAGRAVTVWATAAIIIGVALVLGGLVQAGAS